MAPQYSLKKFLRFFNASPPSCHSFFHSSRIECAFRLFRSPSGPQAIWSTLRNSAVIASMVPVGCTPRWRGLSPGPVRTSVSSNATSRLRVRWAALGAWSASSGHPILVIEERVSFCAQQFRRHGHWYSLRQCLCDAILPTVRKEPPGSLRGKGY